MHMWNFEEIIDYMGKCTINFVFVEKTFKNLNIHLNHEATLLSIEQVE
jgi:hypothetical protein